MSWRRTILTALALAASAVAAPASAVEVDAGAAGGGGTTIVIGSGAPFGFYFAAAGAICAEIAQARANVRCMVEPLRDSGEGLAALKDERVDLALVQSDWLHHAVHGTSRYASDGADDTLRALFSLHGEAFTLLVRSDAEPESLADVGKMRLATGAETSYRRMFTRWLFAAAGLDQPMEAGADNGIDGLCSGSVDAVALVTAHPSAVVTDLVGRCGAKVLSLPESVVAQVVQGRPYLAALTVPPSAYAGQSASATSFGLRAVLAGRDDLDPKLAALILEAVFDDLETLRARHPAFGSLTREGMLSSAVVAPLHAAAEAMAVAAPTPAGRAD